MTETTAQAESGGGVRNRIVDSDATPSLRDLDEIKSNLPTPRRYRRDGCRGGFFGNPIHSRAGRSVGRGRA